MPEPARQTRQGSMRAVFEQSWRLLSEEEQHCLAALSVFRGGFMGDAALAVADADLPMLARLQSRSLVRRVEVALTRCRASMCMSWCASLPASNSAQASCDQCATDTGCSMRFY